jgi:GDPmannose 4,6-dehydratase
MIAATMIVGSSGQDGLILQELLKTREINIIQINRSQIVHPNNEIQSTVSEEHIKAVIHNYQINEIYFLASISAAASSAKNEIKIERSSEELDLLKLLIYILNEFKTKPEKVKIFIASSALIFGNPKLIPQNEACTISPIENYSLFKSLIHSIVDYYRINHNLRIILGILYPHESKHRKPEYLFRRIVDAAQLNLLGSMQKLEISNLNFTREWNCAYQVMLACVKLMELECFENFVVGSGVQYNIEHACELVFGHFGLDSRDYVLSKNSPLIMRSPNLIANPKKLQETIAFVPDGNLKFLIERNYPRSGDN